MSKHVPASRKRRHWLNATLSLALWIVILIVVQKTADRHNVRIDLTPTRRLSLSQGTRQILADLEEDLHIEAYYARDRRQELADLLGRLSDENPRVQ